MSESLTGRIHGKTITLDSPIPPLDGQRVRVSLEPFSESDLQLSPEENTRLFEEWVKRGPQGPLEDDGADFS